MRTKRAGLAAALAACAAAAGCGGDDATTAGAAGATDAAVTVKTFMFEPDPVEIRAGETVTWTNEDSAAHTVTSGGRARPDGRFDERLSESGGTARRTFGRSGTYRYLCSLHSGPGMTGTVIVR